MEWMNYHHLYYFWLVAREGGIVPASRKLKISHPTISTQLRKLEESLDTALFDRSRRRLELTEEGRVVLEYADQIFDLGQELQQVVRGRARHRPSRLVVGITDAMPKLIAKRLLEPALTSEPPVRLVCREDRTDRVLSELAMGNLDVVLADTPVPSGSGLRAYNHLLGECSVAFFAHASAARAAQRNFPRALDGAPFLAPTPDYVLRRELELWFDRTGIQPEIVGEFEDSALLKVFAQDGIGMFAAPSVMSEAIRSQYKLREIGRIDDVKERFYAITMERRLRNPAVLAICEVARHAVFAH
jgi:LysR family transcriptional activator of nhaA